MYFNIFAEMARKQLNEQSMSELMGIPQRLLSAKLNNKSKLTVYDIFKMQKIFNKANCTFEYLIKK